MTPHQVLALMTQEQTQQLVVACFAYLSPEMVHAALKEGFDRDELERLSILIHKEFEPE